jgi:outer membrane protein OmpA-like peptidoglycan-associated protein
MRKTILSLLLLSAAVCVTPASANYFSNPRLGMNLNIGSAPNPTPADIRRGEIVEQSATVYTQAAEEVAPPPPAPPPPAAPLILAVAPPPPAPPPAMRQFVVFFDFDKSNLSPEAMEIVSAAVMAAKDTGRVQIRVTGHTDTVGSQRYNQALSERRAGAVKTQIVRLGLNAGDIATEGKSFSEPLVNTGPGVREPQNRRAVISLGYALTASLDPSAE